MISILPYLAGIVISLTGKIAFLGLGADPSPVLSVIDLETRLVTRVGNGTDDQSPVWSPDGEWLAFVSRRGDGYGVYVVRPDGSALRPLKHRLAFNSQPQWSPDGKMLAYVSDPGGGLHTVIHVYHLERDSETQWGGARTELFSPTWLPSLDLLRALDPSEELRFEGADSSALLEEAASNGILLAIQLSLEKNATKTEPALVTLTQTASLLSLLTKESARYNEWRILSDSRGRQIAFESDEGGDREIYVLGRRGIVNVSNHPAADWNPVWSPDGKWLAFESFRGRRCGVYRVLVATGRIYAVDSSPEYHAWAPTWSPQGNALAYVSDKDGQPTLYVKEFASETEHKIETGFEITLAPTWQPKRAHK